MEVNVVEKLLRLSQLSLDEDETRVLLADLDEIIAFVDTMASVPTDGVAPLSHPMELEQLLRADEPVESIERELMQASAPEVRDGMYVVPRVVVRS